MAETTQERLARHVRALVEEIGERPGGTPANDAAIAYLARALDAAGWAVEEQWFACPHWTDLGTRLALAGRPLEAATNAFSPPVTARGPVVAAGTMAELAAAELRGRIGLLYGALLPAPLSPKAWFLISEEEAALIALLEAQQPAALLTMQRFGGGLERLIEDWEFAIPSATISAAAGRELLRAPGAAAELTIASRREPGRTANVVGRGGGDGPRVVICAHHDTKYGTPGALDNAGGAAVVLALAETLDPARYPFALELVLFANEEYLPIGDDEYLRRQGGDDLGGVLACINIDGAGLAIAPDSITAISAGAALETAVRALAAERPALVWAEPWPESNHSTFAFRGVPSVAFTSATRTTLAHHPADDLSWLDPARLAGVVETIGALLALLGREGMAARL